jgi:hypothetical protein
LYWPANAIKQLSKSWYEKQYDPWWCQSNTGIGLVLLKLLFQVPLAPIQSPKSAQLNRSCGNLRICPCISRNPTYLNSPLVKLPLQDIVPHQYK